MRDIISKKNRFLRLGFFIFKREGVSFCEERLTIFVKRDIIENNRNYEIPRRIQS